eukprot:1151834-Pelagomonas_calceolata.AAC.1
MPNGNKLVGIHNRMGMKFASKFNGTSLDKPVEQLSGNTKAFNQTWPKKVVKPQLFRLAKGMLIITCSTNVQENGMESHSISTNMLQRLAAAAVPPQIVAQALCLHSSLFQSNARAAGIWRLCCANLSSLILSVLTKPTPQGLLLSFDYQSFSNIVAFRCHAGDDVVLTA